mmetsp:Transcript_5457/g.16231  ORF Transcript_5457/g.16231 Transcript_5457/m.16231 type:complete len:254 (-) Transcript_5457:86-847(-)
MPQRVGPTNLPSSTCGCALLTTETSAPTSAGAGSSSSPGGTSPSRPSQVKVNSTGRTFSKTLASSSAGSLSTRTPLAATSSSPTFTPCTSAQEPASTSDMSTRNGLSTTCLKPSTSTPMLALALKAHTFCSALAATQAWQMVYSQGQQRSRRLPSSTVSPHSSHLHGRDANSRDMRWSRGQSSALCAQRRPVSVFNNDIQPAGLSRRARSRMSCVHSSTSNTRTRPPTSTFATTLPSPWNTLSRETTALLRTT